MPSRSFGGEGTGCGDLYLFVSEQYARLTSAGRSLFVMQRARKVSPGVPVDSRSAQAHRLPYCSFMSAGIKLPGYLKPYEYQIAGHHPSRKPECTGLLLHESGEMVWKPLQPPPRGMTEHLFYEIVWREDYSNNDAMASYVQFLRMVIPRYYGITSLGDGDRAKSFIKLENIVHGYHHPCIMDVKIGRQTWAPSADSERVAYEKLKYPYIEQIGFRVLGMSVYDPVTQRRIIRDKEWGKRVEPEKVEEVFDLFFNRSERFPLSIVKRVIDRLRALQVWFNDQDKFWFYSSSILIVYDAKRSGYEPKVDVKMIDFTHVYPGDSIDANYLFGLTELLTRLEAYVKAAKACVQRA